MRMLCGCFKYLVFNDREPHRDPEAARSSEIAKRDFFL